MSERNHFIFYKSFFDAIMRWPDDVKIECFKAIGRYALYGEIPQELSQPSATIFDMAKPQIDANNKKYEDGKKGGSKGGVSNNPAGRRGKDRAGTTTGSSELSTSGSSELTTTGSSEELPNDNVNANVNANVITNPPISSNELMSPQGDSAPQNSEKKNGSVKKFVKPTIDEIKSFIRDRDLNVDAESFYYHYESNGWSVGKSKMKSWQAALLNWNRRDAAPKKHQIRMPL